MTGVDLIAAERQRQQDVEGWTPDHDDEHDDGSLALAAVCYASPVKLYEQHDYAAGPAFRDPWPDSWDGRWDKRFRYGERRTNPGNMAPDPATYTDAERIDLLAKAGALIAAEIDRLLRANGKTDNDRGVGLDAAGG
ncbi:MAG TPA: hypothetical protein PKZ27_11710 [Rhodocyclaceae bacterium]|nr:hypothetical protein [Rhodocyclaceae bacterium]